MRDCSLLGRSFVDFESEQTTLNAVHNDSARLKPGVNTPSTIKLRGRISIVLRVTIKVRQLLHRSTSRIRRNTTGIHHAQSRTVVGLVRNAINNILVMVDGPNGTLVLSSPDGVGKRRDVKNVRGGMGVLPILAALDFIQLIIEKEILEVRVNVPALMGVCTLAVKTFVGDAGHDSRLLLVGHVVDGEGILVVAEADLAALEVLVDAAVDDALGVVDVAVLARAAEESGLSRVLDVYHDETAVGARAACVGGGADNENGVGLFVGDDVVGRSYARVQGSEVRLDAECLGGRADGEQLAKIKDLYAVVARLGANIGMVADDFDIAPDSIDSLRRQATNVLQLATGFDLDERSTVSLTDNGEFAAVRRRPAPDVVTFTGLAAHGVVGEVVLQIDVLAGVLAGFAVDALGGGGVGVFGGGEGAVGLLVVTGVGLVVFEVEHLVRFHHSVGEGLLEGSGHAGEGQGGEDGELHDGVEEEDGMG